MVALICEEFLQKTSRHDQLMSVISVNNFSCRTPMKIAELQGRNCNGFKANRYSLLCSRSQWFLMLIHTDSLVTRRLDSCENFKWTQTMHDSIAKSHTILLEVVATILETVVSKPLLWKMVKFANQLEAGGLPGQIWVVSKEGIPCVF